MVAVGGERPRHAEQLAQRATELLVHRSSSRRSLQQYAYARIFCKGEYMLVAMPEFELVKDAKLHLRAHWEEGVECPCCGQFVKLYKRKLNTSMAMFLISLYKLTANGEYVHAGTALGKSFSMDYATLRHWQLIEEEWNTDETKRRSGHWRITEKGKAFVSGKLQVPSHVHLFNNKLVGWSDAQTDIRVALGKRFDYAELMGFKQETLL